MFRFFTLVLIITPLAASALEPEWLNFQISLLQQSCRRTQADEAFVCSTDSPDEARISVFLKPALLSSLDEQAYEGVSQVLSLAAGKGPRFQPQVSVRKSVAENGGSVIYTLRFRVVPEVPRAPSASFETVFISEDSLHMREPLMLMGDRTGDQLYFKQYYFTLMPTVQFGR